MNNLLSYWGLDDARMSASENDLPVTNPHCAHMFRQACIMVPLASSARLEASPKEVC